MPEGNFADIAAKCRVLLLDIEGTTTSISFVKENLFPYAEAHVRGFLEAGWEGEEVREVVRALRRLSLTDAEEKLEGVVSVPDEDASKEEQIEGLVNSVKWLMSLDRKAGPLKLLQGLIWKQGYDKGDIKGHVYDDVASALTAWRASDSRRVFIYSSGSEQAQRLLFAHSSSGDLLPLLDGHFDTAVGGKLEAASYTNIAGKIDCKPDQILFLTDILKEAEAAREAGMHAALVSREGNTPLPTDVAFPVITSLTDLSAKPTPASTAPAEDTPVAKEETPVAMQETPVAMQETPAKTEETSAKTKETPAAIEETPAKTEETPAKTKETPSKTEETPAATEETPAATEAVTNGASKRKQDEQEEQPAKIAKASVNDDVKTKAAESTESKEAVKSADGMDVDSAPADTPTEKIEVDTDAVKETVVIEELMEADCADAKAEPSPSEPTAVAEPAAEEQTENKTEEESKTESIAADTAEKKETTESSPAQTDQMEAEESPPIITEIEDITDKKSPEEEAETLDLDPIVEEPTESGAAEEELRSAGEVIKECDEVLSKLKNALTEPVLSSIDEETESDNTDSRPTEETSAETELPAVVAEPETKTDEPTADTKEESSVKETTEEAKKTEESVRTQEPESKELPARNGSEEPEKAHLNGDSGSKETNGVKHNGDSTNGEERLAENGEGAGRLNGNGEAAKESAGAGGDAAEAAGAELPEIKVKSVPAADACSEPVEQATDA